MLSLVSLVQADRCFNPRVCFSGETTVKRQPVHLHSSYPIPDRHLYLEHMHRQRLVSYRATNPFGDDRIARRAAGPASLVTDNLQPIN